VAAEAGAVDDDAEGGEVELELELEVVDEPELVDVLELLVKVVALLVEEEEEVRLLVTGPEVLVEKVELFVLVDEPEIPEAAGMLEVLVEERVVTVERVGTEDIVDELEYGELELALVKSW
jgi:hypothetical protein